MKLLLGVAILSLVTMSCRTSCYLPEMHISEIFVIDVPYRGGTTMMLKNYYSEYARNGEAKEKFSIEKAQALMIMLSSAVAKKHRQQKITGIYTGIEWCNAEGCNCLIFTHEKVIDISNDVDYYLSNEEILTLNLILN